MDMDSDFPSDWRRAVLQQAVFLADAGFGSLQERMRWLEQSRFESEHTKAKDYYDEFHKDVTRKIANLSLAHAYLLSEKYKNFLVLSDLTLNAPDRDERTKMYFERFGDEFMFIFYEYLLHKGICLPCLLSKMLS
jgi:hypothetical protein